jgi:hypothetical protein
LGGTLHQKKITVYPEQRTLEQATCRRTSQVEARLKVPYRPQLFGKQPPIVHQLSRVALAKNEVFLILAMIYAEAKRQEKTVCTFKSMTV